MTNYQIKQELLSYLRSARAFARICATLPEDLKAPDCAFTVVDNAQFQIEQITKALKLGGDE